MGIWFVTLCAAFAAFSFAAKMTSTPVLQQLARCRRQSRYIALREADPESKLLMLAIA
jgi:hypothetical protein